MTTPRPSSNAPLLTAIDVAADRIVRTLLEGLPEDLLEAPDPRKAMDIGVLLESDDWLVSWMALDVLGAHISDEPPFGSWMRVPAPVELMSKVALCLQIDVPARAMEELIPRLEVALEAMMREVLGPTAEIHVYVEPAGAADGSVR